MCIYIHLIYICTYLYVYVYTYLHIHMYAFLHMDTITYKRTYISTMHIYNGAIIFLYSGCHSLPLLYSVGNLSAVKPRCA